MDAFVAMVVVSLTQAATLLTDLRQVIGLVAAFLLAVAAAQLGWQGTDRVLARRGRTDED
jgi:hypothetical protein